MPFKLKRAFKYRRIPSNTCSRKAYHIATEMAKINDKLAFSVTSVLSSFLFPFLTFLLPFLSVIIHCSTGDAKFPMPPNPLSEDDGKS